MLNQILLQEAQASSGYSSIIMIVAMVAIFYFFMMRPQQQQQKKIRKFREGLNVGDKVVTAGGIHGTLRQINNDTVKLQIANDVIIKIDINSIYPSAQEAQENANQQTPEAK